MRFKEYPILKLLLSIVIGIIAARFALTNTIIWYWILPIISVLAFLAWPRKYLFPYRFRFFSGMYIYGVFVLLGMLLYQSDFDKTKNTFFGNFSERAQKYHIKIIEPPQEKKKTIKVFGELQSCNIDGKAQKCIGKLLIYLQKDSLSKKLTYGDNLVIDKKPQEISEASNPDQFDYKAYLALKDIHYQVYLRGTQWQKIPIESSFSIIHFALDVRSKLLDVLQQNNIKGDELSVAAGMLLGVRDILSPELHQAYAGAGAMHILCVSGLHVGIIFMILNWLLTFLNYRNNGKLIKAIMIMSAIWFYALLTGFSPSVVRAATMFSFIIIGQNLNRHVNIFSSLSASAFVLLLVNPTLLFDLGFQLSYSAVVAIVILQKPIANLWVPNNKLIYQAWQLVAVSIAAQIGTAPLSLYYFHQFPNLFIITNLIVIPAAYIIINLGILVLFFSFIPPISAFLGKILSYILYGLNYLITGIEQLEFAVTRNIFLSPLMFCLIACLIIFVSIWLLQKRRKLIFTNLSLIIGILIASLFNYDNSNEFIIYQSNRNTYMAVYSQRQAWIICDTAVYNDPSIMSFQVSAHELRKGIRHRNYFLMDSVPIIQSDLFYINYPFIKCGNKLIKFSNPNSAEEGGFANSFNYIVYNNPKQYSISALDSLQTAIICSNIPPWTSKPILQEYDSLNLSFYSIKENGAWRIGF